MISSCRTWFKVEAASRRFSPFFPRAKQRQAAASGGTPHPLHLSRSKLIEVAALLRSGFSYSGLRSKSSTFQLPKCPPQPADGAVVQCHPHPTDEADFKSHVFPLLFFKRISDVHDEEHAGALKHFGGDDGAALFAENYGFQIPEKCHWADVRKVATNVGQALQSSSAR